MRKQATITITLDGRDSGKVFQITEMPASQAEDWAIRAFMALAKSGVEVPEDLEGMGMGALAALGFQALSGIDYSLARPLLDEMMGCVQRIPDPSKPVVRPLIDDDTEEVATRLFLRREVLELHTGFFTKGVPSTSTSQKSETGASATIRTSRAR